jgi:transketolase
MILHPITKKVILTFMHEAKTKNDLTSGFHQEYKQAIGLVDVCISFEAFTNELKPSESDLKKKRRYFSDSYQVVFENHKDTFSDWIHALKKELEDNGSLRDMTPNSRRAPLTIDNINSLSQVIEVIYRVRSNLVHGSKDLTEQRNKVLIENSFKFLYNLLDIILKKEALV